MLGILLQILIGIYTIIGGRSPVHGLIVKAPAEVEIKVPSTHSAKPYFGDCQSYQGVSAIWLSDKNTNTLTAYNIFDGRLLHRWCFAKMGIGDIRTFYIHRSDSVLLYTKNADHARQLIWYNPIRGTAEAVSYGVHMHLVGVAPDTLERLWETVEAPSSAPIRFYNGKIIGGILPYLPIDRTPTEHKSTVFALDSKVGRLDRWPIFWPQAYCDREVQYDYRAIRTLLKGDSLIVGFGGSPEILIWNLKQLSLDTLDLSVPGIQLQEPPPVDSALIHSQQLLSRGYFGRLFYHAELKLFLRVVYLPTPIFDPATELYTPFEERRACLFIWDENFVPLANLLLPPGANDRNAFCTSDAFMILDPNQTQSDSAHHTLTYLKYEIAR